MVAVFRVRGRGQRDGEQEDTLVSVMAFRDSCFWGLSLIAMFIIQITNMLSYIKGKGIIPRGTKYLCIPN
jgi:hypothetical protein